MGDTSFLQSVLGKSGESGDILGTLHKEVDQVFHDFLRGVGWSMRAPSVASQARNCRRLIVIKV